MFIIQFGLEQDQIGNQTSTIIFFITTRGNEKYKFSRQLCCLDNNG